jgi:TM2 domain-containing membrane protein YozV
MTISSDAQALMAYQANSRSVGVSYALWFFLGAFGAHRFYNGRVGTGIVQLLCLLFCWLIIPGIVLAIWWVVDAFLIQGWVRDHNARLMVSLGANANTAIATSAG